VQQSKPSASPKFSPPPTRDRDLRRALRTELAKATGPKSVVFEEFWVPLGDHRVDVAVVDTKLRGFELKSASDTLERLPAQVIAFNRIFDYMTLVVDSTLALSARALVPDWWGVVEVRWRCGHLSLVRRRAARSNPSPDQATRLLMLWRADLIDAAASAGLGKVDRFAKDRLRRLLADALDDRILNRVVVSAIRRRPELKAALAG
jgi:hypothetical protein